MEKTILTDETNTKKIRPVRSTIQLTLEVTSPNDGSVEGYEIARQLSKYIEGFQFHGQTPPVHNDIEVSVRTRKVEVPQLNKPATYPSDDAAHQWTAWMRK